MDIKNIKIAVVGLGYVGLPLLVEFGKRYPTLGFDLNSERINSLKQQHDSTLELSSAELAEAKYAEYSDASADLTDCNVFIVTVPTPVDHHKRPLLEPLQEASKTIAPYLKAGDLVIYESTVYPGASEEVCVPILEEMSGLTLNESFFLGYSPERINPGDKVHRLTTIQKITSGSNKAAAEFVDDLYNSIIPAGTHPVSSIKVAEAAKVIENTQRDLNIALINELCLIFHKIGIDTEEVLNAAGTKWNFLPFRPGLVGGHCIGVDPYYLTYKAESLGYRPEVILAGRRINDGMGSYIADRLVKKMTQEKINAVDANVLIMGLSFKENCTDLRNTKVIDILNTLHTYNVKVDVYDPWIEPDTAKKEYGLSLLKQPDESKYDAIIVAVAHDEFRDMGLDKIRKFGKSNSVIFDIKYLFPIEENLYRL
ncbi:nucleotide sugar dehydrogenase [Haliea sp. AH-315-K21]|uniref:Vi polysaccharide biosynthesis protein VipA/TviB n=1 Tax=SAR86 cluster bacterium TaxID=2030880 RepID=A0A2A5C937_9GAMM|nr:nucleotide sugar dehydrogenase [Haliea sp. AH-315-K21]PCJ39981.1 MAG: Vi polysaccharide biosynthesis protein VipA/TviB [SAR86 cluster bacterium]